MGYRVERLSLLFTCKNCTTNQMFTGDSLDYIVERAKVEGWTLPWKLKNIKPTIYESTEDTFCPSCSKPPQNGIVTDRYIVYYPPGKTVIDEEHVDNSELATIIINQLHSNKDIRLSWKLDSGWKILHQINDKWIELVPRTNFTEKEI